MKKNEKVTSPIVYLISQLDIETKIDLVYRGVLKKAFKLEDKLVKQCLEYGGDK